MFAENQICKDMESLLINSMRGDELAARLTAIEGAINQIAATLKPQPAGNKEYLTRKEVAALLQITLPTVNDWTRKGVLKAYKIGKRVYYKPLEVSAAMVQKGGAQ